MTSGSVRLRAHDPHQHQDPPPEADRAALPDPRAEANGSDAEGLRPGRLWRENGKVMYQDDSGEPPRAVRVVWARPLSERGEGGPLSVMEAGKKREIAFFPSLADLPEESRRVAAEELASRLVLPRITAIRSVRPRFGNYYWDVETDRGRRRFLVSAPENNSIRPRPDVIVVKDVSGNCFEIAPVSGLDAASRRELDRVL